MFTLDFYLNIPY